MPWKGSQRGSGRAGRTTVSATSQTFPAEASPGGVRGAFPLEFPCLQRQDRYSPKGLLGWESRSPDGSPAVPERPGPAWAGPDSFPHRRLRGGFLSSSARILRCSRWFEAKPDEPATEVPMEGVTKLSIPDLGQWSRDQRGRTGFDRMQEVQIACRGWSAGHVKSRPSFNCRSSVFSGCLVKQPRAMAPVGRASQSVAKSDSLHSTAGYGWG